MTVRWALGSSVGCSSWSSEAGSIRWIASSAVDHAFVGHIDRDLERGRGGALAGAGLQHVELVLLDRELDVLHVAVVAFEPQTHRVELAGTLPA